MPEVSLAQMCLNLSGIPNEPAGLSDVFGNVKNNYGKRLRYFKSKRKICKAFLIDVLTLVQQIARFCYPQYF